MKKSWYSIKNEQGKPGEISIYDAIGATWDGEGVTAKGFIADLKKIDAKEINLFINSPGGNVMDGLAIYNALRQHGAKINVKVMGVAASAASFIAMAGDTIEMPENTFLMVHNPMSFAFGNANEMRDVADTLDKIGSSLIGIYVAASGKSEAEVKAILDAETWLTAAEAKDFGFPVTVTADAKIAAKYNPSRLPQNVVNAMFKGAMPSATAGCDDDEAVSVAISADGKVLVVGTDDAVTTYDWIVVEGAGSWVQRPFVLDVEDDSESEDTGSGMMAFADQVSALATAAEMPEFASIWALSKADIAAVEASIAEAREIKSLCALVKAPEKATEFIRAKLPLASVREKLTNTLAEQDEKTHTDTAPRNSNSPASNAQSNAGLKVSDVWAARRKIN